MKSSCALNFFPLCSYVEYMEAAIQGESASHISIGNLILSWKVDSYEMQSEYLQWFSMLTNLYNLREAEMQKCTWWRNFGLWSCQKLICLWRWVNIKFLFFVLPPSVSAGLVWNGNLERGTKFKVQRIGANWRGGWVAGVYHFQGNIWIVYWQIL